VSWIALGPGASAYPAALRALRGKSGVYAIRKPAGWISSAEVLYVGESHTGRLYQTLTRHFQQWRRGKDWWRGKFSSEQTDPGHTYDRGAVEVMWKVATPARAILWQSAWIRSFKPRDNSPDVGEVPF
jgi:hypothetical protein